MTQTTDAVAQQPINMDCEVVLHFDLKLTDGSAAESTRVHDKPAKLRMGDGSLTDKFEACLLGLTAGQQREFTLAPEDAFGMPNPNNIVYMDATKFGGDAPATVGMIIGFAQPDGSELPGIVREVTGQSVTVDFNHPLAGQTVIFAVEILEVKKVA